MYSYSLWVASVKLLLHAKINLCYAAYAYRIYLLRGPYIGGTFCPFLPEFDIVHQRMSQNLETGYNAPECTKPSAYTVKSDVYSFGVVMLELLTGRLPFDRCVGFKISILVTGQFISPCFWNSLLASFIHSSKPRYEQYLVRWASPQLHDIDALAKLVDPALHGLYPPKSLSQFADAVALCVQVRSYTFFIFLTPFIWFSCWHMQSLFTDISYIWSNTLWNFFFFGFSLSQNFGHQCPKWCRYYSG